jgi:hypothetical protein
MKLSKAYPDWCCSECGMKHGKAINKISTWHYGKCDVCGENNNVTQPRDFGHFPNWFERKKK